jgi:hypothetical protein
VSEHVEAHPAVAAALDGLERGWPERPASEQPEILVVIAAGPYFPSEVAIRAEAPPPIVLRVMLECAKQYALSHGLPFAIFEGPASGFGAQG